MPIASVRYTAAQFGVDSFTALNDQIGFWAVNNSGQYLANGDVVVFDTTTAADTHAAQVEGAQTLTQATQTLTVDSTTGFATAGNLLVSATPVGGGSAVSVFGTYTGVTATTFTGFTCYAASAANGAADEANISVPPVPILARAADSAAANVSTGVFVAQPAAPGAGGRAVTLTGLSKDPNVCGVVSVDGTANTVTVGPAASGGQVPAAGTAGAGWNGYTGGGLPVIPPGGDVFVVVSGVARVNIAGLTVAAGGIMTSATIPGTADDTPGTLGNLLGIALESQAAKDANNTIRCAIKIG